MAGCQSINHPRLHVGLSWKFCDGISIQEGRSEIAKLIVCRGKRLAWGHYLRSFPALARTQTSCTPALLLCPSPSEEIQVCRASPSAARLHWQHTRVSMSSWQQPTCWAVFCRHRTWWSSQHFGGVSIRFSSSLRTINVPGGTSEGMASGRLCCNVSGAHVPS